MQQTKELYVNDRLVDLGSDPISLSFQVNNLGDLQSQQGNYSKAFKVPLTQNNRIIFGFPDDIIATTNIPYQQLPAKYIDCGIEIIPNGLIEIIDVNNGELDLMLLSGNIDFLDSLGGQIYDMGDSTSIYSDYGRNLVWKQYDHDWTVINAALSQKKTDGWIWPIVNYGNLDTIPPFSGSINVRDMRPGFFLHTAIDLLVESTGYTIDKENSCLFNDPYFSNLYQKLIIQFANGSFDHGTDYQNTPDLINGFNTTLGTDLIITKSKPYNDIIHFNPAGQYDGTRYSPGKNISGTVNLTFDASMLGIYETKTPSIVHINLYVSDIYTGSRALLASSDLSLDSSATFVDIPFTSLATQEFKQKKLSFDVDLTPNTTTSAFFINYSIDNSKHTAFTMKAGATLSFVTDQTSVSYSQTIQCERILPDVSQIDLLKDTLQRFGLILIANPNTGKIMFTSFKTIIGNIPRANDWSDKLLDMGKNIAFNLGRYSQVNWLRYQYDSQIPKPYMPKFFADDYIAINDKTLNPVTPQQDLFTSIFSPSINRPYIGGSTAQISSPDNTEPFSVGSSPRLLVDQKLDILSLGKTVTFQDTDPAYRPSSQVFVNDVISVPYFYKPGGDFNLCFCDKDDQKGLKSKYYPEMMRILTQTKAITRYFLLTPLDIAKLDFTIPIYIRQDGGYYYITKVENWIKGQPTKVSLVKLN